jgi:hypothetical protein
MGKRDGASAPSPTYDAKYRGSRSRTVTIRVDNLLRPTKQGGNEEAADRIQKTPDARCGILIVDLLGWGWPEWLKRDGAVRRY